MKEYTENQQELGISLIGKGFSFLIGFLIKDLCTLI